MKSSHGLFPDLFCLRRFSNGIQSVEIPWVFRLWTSLEPDGNPLLPQDPLLNGNLLDFLNQTSRQHTPPLTRPHPPGIQYRHNKQSNPINRVNPSSQTHVPDFSLPNPHPLESLPPIPTTSHNSTHSIKPITSLFPTFSPIPIPSLNWNSIGCCI